MKTLKSLATPIRAVSRLALLGVLIAAAPLVALAQNPVLIRTFNNPTPNANDYFGTAMAALGNDRVLIGAQYDDTTATDAGAVYLFHTNGTLLTTITNPNPVFTFPYTDARFGPAIATVGRDRIVIGSSSSAKVYLFATNGALVTTLTSPSIYDTAFGTAVAAFGNDRVLVSSTSAYLSSDPDFGATQGAAFLYGTNGTLLMTFFNPYPEAVGLFGWSVCAFGSDRLLIGSSGAGAVGVFLFHTNGTLLTTFTNPAPSSGDIFGRQFAAVGTDRVLVGSPTHGTNTGSVYVFNTNGNLLTVITNPTPAVNDSFGQKLVALGNDRVLIGAPGDDTGATNAGSAYVYSIDGTLLATLINPTPAAYDIFGWSLASFGNEGAIIGAPLDNSSGSAYLFNIPAAPQLPSLTIRRTTTNTVVVSWPATATGFGLQQNTNGVSSVNWSNVTSGILNDGTNKSLMVNPAVGNRFYRLNN